MTNSRRVLVAGTFDPTFARNRVVVALLRRAGFDVTIAQRELWGHERPRLVEQSKWRLALRALRVYPWLFWTVIRAPRPDVVVVLYPGYFDMPVVRVAASIRRIPVLFDTFISLFDTIVGDRQLRDRQSLVGRTALFADRFACRLADLALVDTPSHAELFHELTGVPADRFRVLWLGAQEDVFHPDENAVVAPGRVVFHGTFIRLQGLETIVKAAKLLDGTGITFRIVGDGQERRRIEGLMAELAPSNIELIGLVPREQVPEEIAAAELCLGIFGTSAKAGRVVPNKLFECLAMRKPVLTGDTPAIRAAFDTTVEVAVVPPGDAAALAEAIRRLLADPARLAELAERGHARYLADYSEAALAERLAGCVGELAP